MDLLLHL